MVATESFQAGNEIFITDIHVDAVLYFPAVGSLTSFGTTFPVMRKVLLFTSCGRIVTFPAQGGRHLVPKAARPSNDKKKKKKTTVEQSWNMNDRSGWLLSSNIWLMTTVFWDLNPKKSLIVYTRFHNTIYNLIMFFIGNNYSFLFSHCCGLLAGLSSNNQRKPLIDHVWRLIFNFSNQLQRLVSFELLAFENHAKKKTNRKVCVSDDCDRSICSCLVSAVNWLAPLAVWTPQPPPPCHCPSGHTHPNLSAGARASRQSTPATRPPGKDLGLLTCSYVTMNSTLSNSHLMKCHGVVVTHSELRRSDHRNRLHALGTSQCSALQVHAGSHLDESAGCFPPQPSPAHTPKSLGLSGWTRSTQRWRKAFSQYHQLAGSQSEKFPFCLISPRSHCVCFFSLQGLPAGASAGFGQLQQTDERIQEELQTCTFSSCLRFQLSVNCHPGRCSREPAALHSHRSCFKRNFLVKPTHKEMTR